QEHGAGPEHDLLLLRVPAQRGDLAPAAPDDGVETVGGEVLGGDARVARSGDQDRAGQRPLEAGTLAAGVPAVAEAVVRRQLAERGEESVELLGGGGHRVSFR